MGREDEKVVVYLMDEGDDFLGRATKTSVAELRSERNEVEIHAKQAGTSAILIRITQNITPHPDLIRDEINDESIFSPTSCLLLAGDVDVPFTVGTVSGINEKT